MSEKVQQSGGASDLVKWLIVTVLMAAGIYGYSVYFAGESVLYRIMGMLVIAGISGWLAIQTAKGRAFFNLCLEARSEIRKVVWPTRQETTQTTLIVVVVVIILGIILWGVDSLISWIINLVIG